MHIGPVCEGGLYVMHKVLFCITVCSGIDNEESRLHDIRRPSGILVSPERVKERLPLSENASLDIAFRLCL